MGSRDHLIMSSPFSVSLFFLPCSLFGGEGERGAEKEREGNETI